MDWALAPRAIHWGGASCCEDAGRTGNSGFSGCVDAGAARWVHGSSMPTRTRGIRMAAVTGDFGSGRCARSTGAHTKTRRASVRVERIRGEGANWAAESVAPSGARFDLVMEPTADAVGYRLSVLRTCRGSQGRTRSHGEGDEDVAAPFLFSNRGSLKTRPQPWKP